MLFRCLLFGLFAFSLNAQVLDESAIVNYPLQNKPGQFPDNCLANPSSECLIDTDFHRKYPLDLQHSVLQLGSDSSVLKKADHSIHLIRGEVWWEGTGILHTEFGSIECIDCVLYISRDKEQVYVSSMGGEVYLLPKNYKSKILLPKQMENWMKGVSVKTGYAQTGIPKPYMIKKQIRKMAQFFRSGKINFRDRVVLMRRQWAAQVHASSKEYQNLGQDRILAAVEKKRKKAEKKRKMRKQSEVYRQMLRRRAFEGL